MSKASGGPCAHRHRRPGVPSSTSGAIRHALLAALLAAGAPLHATEAAASASTNPVECAFDPASGAINPLGNRSFIRIRERDGAIIFIYEELPAIVGVERVTLAVQRTLIVHDRSLDAARAWLRGNDEVYAELVGYDDPDGYAPVDDTIRCR